MTLETDAPRRNGELVFDAPWEARAFGLAVALLEQHGLTWDDFRPYLVEAIEAEPALSYYEHVGLALERFAASLYDWAVMPPSTVTIAPVK